MHKEVGRELSLDEIQVDTVVVMQAELRPDIMLTVWVKEKTPLGVTFAAHALKPNVIMLLTPGSDGKLRDDHGRAIHVFEFLGSVGGEG